MPFSKEEDVRLYEGLKEYGQKWTSISKEFFDSSRSDIQLKNRFKTVSFQQFYAKVAARAMEIARTERRRAQMQGGDYVQEATKDNAAASEASNNDERTPMEKRLQTSLATQVLGEDVPKPPPGKYFTPIGAAQILSRIGKSERRR